MLITILKVIFWFAVVGFVGVNVLFKGKPCIALYLFIRDEIKREKHRFNGFGFWLFCGLGGSGKTLSMVEYLTRMKMHYPRLKVYTNFNFKLSDGKIENWQDIIDFENYHLKKITKEQYLKLDEYNRETKRDRYYEKIHDGIIFGFDEIHLTFASQNWSDCPDNMLDYISQQRKLHKQIVASSQVFTRIDKKLREQTNFVIECSSLFNGRWVFNKYFHTPEYLANDEKGDNGARKRRRAKRYNFIGFDCIRNNYDTFQVMKNLQPKRASDTLIEQLIAQFKEK